MANRNLFGVLSMALALTFGHAAWGAESAPQGSKDLRLATAAMQGDRETMRSLLKQHLDVNIAQGDGMTALHWAAYRNDLEMAKMLIAAGASQKAVTRIEGLTPLAIACTNGNAGMIETLLAAGASVNVSDSIWTPLMLASSSGSAEAVKALLDHGADVNAKEVSHNQTAVMFAAARNRDAVIRALAARGADLNATTNIATLARVRVDANGNPLPKNDAAAIGNNAAPNASVIGGMTALHFAARDGQKDAVRALVEAGADVNKVSPGDKSTPLVIAITNGHYDVAKYLADHGADPNLATIDGLAALYATIDCQWKPVSWEPTPRTEQESTSYLDLMKTLLEHGADPNQKLTKALWFRPVDHNGMWVRYSGTTAFWRAAQGTDVDAMKLLVAHGADPKISSDQKDSPLAMAAGVGWAGNFSQNAPESFLKAAKYLVEEIGAEINTADIRGYTPLMGAAFRGDNEVVQYLVDHGAKMDARTEKGWSASDMANGPCCFAIGGSLPPPHPETVAFLLKLGAPELLKHDGEETLGINDRNRNLKSSAKKPEEAAKPEEKP
jgi:ankyrin repeat protein